MRFLIKSLWLLGLLLGFPILDAVAATAPSETVVFYASKTSWTDGEYVGHAFMCLTYPLNIGIKEECYGFYPKVPSAFIGGPGMVESEFRKNPARFSRITVSVDRSITLAQRREILKLSNEWNTKNYKLTDASCIDFVASIAAAIGMKIPRRSETQLPADFLSELKKIN